MKIFYSRVSKEEEGRQDQESHKRATFEKYGLKDDDVIIYEEKGSAYDISKFGKRKEFIAILVNIFEADKTTILDVFLGNYKKKEVDLYVFDWHRIMRNFEFCNFFALLCDFFDINVYSCKQGLISRKDEENPAQKFARYMMLSVHSFSGEEYSYTISQNIKKGIDKTDGITWSTKEGGKKWGSKFRNIDGEYIELDKDEIQKVNELIGKKIKFHEDKGHYHYYDKIIKYIKDKYKVSISKSYITKIKKFL